MKKAIFSTITGFFLVVVIVFGLIFFLSFYTNIVNLGSNVRENMQVYEEAKQVKNNLFICHGHTSLKSQILSQDNTSSIEDLNCRLPDTIYGYEVEQTNKFGCEEKKWIIGANRQTTSQTITYKILVLQDTGNKNCIATLSIWLQK